MDRGKLLILIGMISAVSFVIAIVALAVAINLNSSAVDTLPVDQYEVFFIEGMPCVSVPRIDGISCDWSKWAGR